MIIGIGADLCDIRRIESMLARHGARFTERLFTAQERARADARPAQVRACTYAKRFAAKEAAAKALGTGFRNGVFFNDLGVVSLPSGQPTLAMTNGAASQLARLVPAGMKAVLHLTMTDDYPYAYAQVMIEALPEA